MSCHTCRKLRKTWKDQDFHFTKEQQEEYDILLQARKERVKFFYESNRVLSKVVKKVESRRRGLTLDLICAIFIL